jgi:hypothetical protein
MGAWISPGGVYRTLLWRTFGDRDHRRPMAFGMLNPSTADAFIDDPTIRRCLGFAYRENCGGIIVVNASPYRATDPHELRAAREAGKNVYYTAANIHGLNMASDLFGKFVLAWGAGIPLWLDDQAGVMMQAARGLGLCLGTTKAGMPRHPLYVRSDVQLTKYQMRPSRG